LTVRPIDIARKLNISTSALRHYEDWGIIPPVERGANGYRVYTEVHVAYFECIRAMNAGFGMGQRPRRCACCCGRKSTRRYGS